jgi:hypothetical protein
MSTPRPSFLRLPSLRSMSVLCLTVVLAACNSVSPGAGETSPAAPPAEPRAIGGDRDAHGCLVAAGYAWCERERACVRPWELAKEKGFDNSADGFSAYCTAKP